MAYVVVGWFLVTVIQGDVNETLTVIAAVGAVSFIVGSILGSVRG